MIKAIITDVDGVIVGNNHGVNFPLPNEEVIKKLQDLYKRGIPVVLNTGKFSYAILEIIRAAGLRNPHITDGGALILDPLANKIIKTHFLERPIAKAIVEACLREKIYVEGFGVEDYYVQKNQLSSFAKTRIAILQKRHKEVDSLVTHLDTYDVIKLAMFVDNKEEKPRIESLVKPFLKDINFIWSHHPVLEPIQPGLVTAKGVSKKHASIEVLKYINRAPEDTLGIGDTLSDWHFMEMCGYVGVTGKHSNQLIENAKSKGEGKYFLGNDVNHDGFLEIVDYFFRNS